jgi:hypothetical protein
MDKKIVIAVDDSRHSKNAVQYAAGIYEVLEDMKFTLMHVQPTISEYLLDEFQQGNFGTLVVGRRGMNKKFFTGSVSGYLMNGFSEGALWVVP